MPPLRERLSDIPLLANFFLKNMDMKRPEDMNQITKKSISPVEDRNIEIKSGGNDSTAQERDRFLEALESTKYTGTGRWNLTAAARKLNIPKKTFTYRLKKLGIN